MTHTYENLEILDIYPLVVPRPHKPVHHSTTDVTSGSKEKFIMQHYFGNYCPAYSVDNAVYGLKGATPLAPKGNEITQVHYVRTSYGPSCHFMTHHWHATVLSPWSKIPYAWRTG